MMGSSEDTTGTNPIAPDEVIDREMTEAVASFWRSWFVSRALDTIYRKLLYFLVAQWPKAELSPARLIAPVRPLQFDDNANDDAAVTDAFIKAIAAHEAKTILRPVYCEPQPPNWQFQGELFSTITKEAVVIPQECLVIFLIPPGGEVGETAQLVYAFGLVLPKDRNIAAKSDKPIPAVIRLATAEAEQGEAALIASTLPFWVAPLFELLATEMARPSQVFFLPAPPSPDLAISRREVAERSILPRYFELIQRTISPQDLQAVRCYLCSPNRNGATLHTLAASEEYPRIHVPDIPIVTSGGLNWDGMGLSGRAAVTGQEIVSRYGGVDIEDDDVRDPRPLYPDTEGMVEAVAIPIKGGHEKASGLGIADEAVWNVNLPGRRATLAASPRHLYALLYVYTTQRGLLKPEHVLWLREAANVLSEYFGWASASSMRDRQLSRDHEIGYECILAAVDSEREAHLKPFLEFVYEAVKDGQEREQVSASLPSLELLGHAGYLLPGVTLIYFDIAGYEGVPGWYHRAETRERLLFPLERIARNILYRWLDKRRFVAARAVSYRGGILCAVVLAPRTELLDLLSLIYMYLAHCRCNLRGPSRPSLSAFTFHRTFDQLADAGFRSDPVTGKVPAASEVYMALRRLDQPLYRYRKELEQAAIAAAEGRDARIGGQPRVYFEDHWTAELLRFEPSPPQPKEYAEQSVLPDSPRVVYLHQRGIRPVASPDPNPITPPRSSPEVESGS